MNSLFKKSLGLFLLAATLFSTSCRKDDFDNPPAGGADPALTVNTTIADLKANYVMGQFQTITDDKIIAGVVTEVCVAFPALSALEEGYEVFVVTDASGTFNELTRHSAWERMSNAGAQLMTWFGVACELHRDWRNDIEGLGALFSNHIPDYRNLITSYTALTK